MTRATEIIAPSSDQTILADVKQWLSKHGLEKSHQFEDYDNALKAVWPHIYTTNPTAAIFLSINIYLECADELGFIVEPVYLKRAKQEGTI